MSLIAPLNTTEKKPFTVRLKVETADELRKYCEFLNRSPQDYVIEQALEMVFRKDKAFARWKAEAAAPSASTSEPAVRTKAVKA